jgi:two-component system, OmpR family, phosphate regulon sensor histidine kinase PhoR
VTSAHEQLAHFRPLLVALLDEVREPLFGLDQYGTIVHANAAGAALLARQRTHLIGKPFASLLELDSRRPFRLALAHAQAERSELDVRVRGIGATTLTLRALTGVSPRHVLVASGALAPPVEAPAPSRAVQAREVAAALELFFLRFPFGVIGLYDDGRVAFANPRARHLLESTPIRVGRRFTPPEALAGAVQRVLAIPAVGQSMRVELEDGRIVRATGTGASKRHPAILMLEDITRSRREGDVMQTFLRNAAHQLRTPLTSIATAIEVLQSGAKEDPAARDRFLSHIDEHAHRLVRIARSLLVLARAQSGEPLRFDSIRIAPLLAELVAETTAAPGVDIVVDCDPQLETFGERDLMQEALSALVDNAVQHTREGTIRVAATASNGHVSITVTDDGGGILPEHRKRIFEPFYRPIATPGGYGLGLAIAAQAIRAMDGDLAAEEAERGARFRITLPSGTNAR